MRAQVVMREKESLCCDLSLHCMPYIQQQHRSTSFHPFLFYSKANTFSLWYYEMQHFPTSSTSYHRIWCVTVGLQCTWCSGAIEWPWLWFEMLKLLLSGVCALDCVSAGSCLCVCISVWWIVFVCETPWLVSFDCSSSANCCLDKWE